jgi:hypothetical protein
MSPSLFAFAPLIRLRTIRPAFHQGLTLALLGVCGLLTAEQNMAAVRLRLAEVDLQRRYRPSFCVERLAMCPLRPVPWCPLWLRFCLASPFPRRGARRAGWLLQFSCEGGEWKTPFEMI